MASFDRPREAVAVRVSAWSGIAAEDELRLRCRVRLLTLAGDLDDLGLRARLNDSFGSAPALLRVWDPERQGPTVIVACLPDTAGRLQFRYHPSGVYLADAQEALEPGDTVDAARDVAAELEAAKRGRA